MTDMTTKRPTMNRISQMLNRLGYSYKRDNTGNTYVIYTPIEQAPIYIKLCPDGTILRSGSTMTLNDLQNELLRCKTFDMIER